MAFSCSICEEESTRICVNCTKDTCGNHLCDKCAKCSDCCDCEVALENHDAYRVVPVREAYPFHDNHRGHENHLDQKFPDAKFKIDKPFE